jgi:predicted MFS family arabinose efflux permease
LVLSWLRAVAAPEGRRVLLLVFLVDAPFAFLYLIALQTYFDEQTLLGTSTPGLCLALFGAGKLVAQYAGGRLTDRLGLRAATATGLVLIVGAQAGLLAASAVTALILPASLAYGAGSAVVWPAVFARAARLNSDARSQIAAAMTVTTGASVALAFGLGMVLPESFSFGLAVAGTLVVVVIALALTYFGAREVDETVIVTVEPGVVGPNAGKVIGLRDVFGNPALLRLGCVYLLLSAAVGALLSVFRAIGRDIFDVSLREEMFLLLPAAAGFALGVALAGLLGEVAGRRNLMAVAFCAAAIAFLALSRSDATALSVALLAVGCFGLGLAVPTTTATSLDLSRDMPGLTFGFLLTLEGLGHAAGPAIGALFGSVEGVMTLVGGLLAASFVAALGLNAAGSAEVATVSAATTVPSPRQAVVMQTAGTEGVDHG